MSDRDYYHRLLSRYSPKYPSKYYEEYDDFWDEVDNSVSEPSLKLVILESGDIEFLSSIGLKW